MSVYVPPQPLAGDDARQRGSTDGGDLRVADQDPLPRTTHLRLLGGFRLTDHGATVHLPLNAQRTVAFVALQDRGTTRARVAGALWDESSEERASANMRGIVWSLNKVGVRLLDVHDGRLSLSSDVLLDTVSMTQAAGEVLSSMRVDASTDLSAFGDDLLPDWSDEWVIPARERLHQMRLHALERVCRGLTEQGHLHAAVQAGLLAVAAEPLRESAHRVLMQAYLAEGNHAEAVRQYRLFAEILLGELQLRPSTALLSLLSST
ncbi:MAG: transcriptional regulator, family [Frankiales bacterium]|nr:transcriptional regulator, family [Frankiales bacterium]